MRAWSGGRGREAFDVEGLYLVNSATARRLSGSRPDDRSRRTYVSYDPAPLAARPLRTRTKSMPGIFRLGAGRSDFPGAEQKRECIVGFAAGFVVRHDGFRSAETHVYALEYDLPTSLQCVGSLGVPSAS